MSLPCTVCRVLLFLTCSLCVPGQNPFDIASNSDIANMSSAGPLAGPPGSELGDRPRTTIERTQWALANTPTFPSDREPRAAPGTVSVAELRNPALKTELTLMQQALRFANSGDHAAAIQVLKRGLAEGSSMAHARGMLAAEYLKAGKIRAAISQLQIAIELAPLAAANYANLGFALYRLGDTENGERQVREAIRLDKNQPKSHYLLGLILLDRGTPEARDELLRARNELSAARLALAVYHEHHGQMDEAERQIQAFLRMSPSADPAGTEIWVAATAALERPASAFGLRTSQIQ
jgi:tetratricopeptide (TPR) repeat protein